MTPIEAIYYKKKDLCLRFFGGKGLTKSYQTNSARSFDHAC